MLIRSTLITVRRVSKIDRMSILIEVPRGLNCVAVTDTTIGDVLAAEGRYHYRGHDATVLARTRSFEEVWHLVAVGHLPDADELAAFRRVVRRAHALPGRSARSSNPSPEQPARRSDGSAPPSPSPPTTSDCDR